MVRVSLIIVNWNGRHYLEGCLASLAQQDYTDCEIVLVDNASVDDSVAFIRERYPAVRLIENVENVGFAGANIQALEWCRGEYIGLLNNDTEIHPGWLERLVAALDAAPDAGGACGTIYSLEDRERVIFTLPKVDPRSGGVVWVKQPAPRCRVDYLLGASMLARRSAIQRIGFLDPAYVAYFEEIDWCARALRAGYDLLYVPEAIVWHKERGSTSVEFHTYQMARNRVRFVLKNFDVDFLPTFPPHYALDIARSFARFIRDGQWQYIWLVARTWLWNVRHLRATLAARRRDLTRIGPARRSYNRSLPLRHHVSDGRGGLRPPVTALDPGDQRSATAF